jgi:hypothetical protein
VAAITVTASLLAQTLPSFTTGGASRLAAGTKSSSESTTDSGSQFPELLAGLVLTSEAAEGDSHAISGVVPSPDLVTARTPLGGKQAPWHGDAVSPVVSAIANRKHSPERKTAGEHAGSTEQSDAASKLGVAAAKALGPEQQAITPVISPLQMQPVLPSVTVAPKLPEDSIALSGADGEPVAQSPVQTSNLALWTALDVAGTGKTSLVEFDAGLGLSGVASVAAH